MGMVVRSNIMAVNAQRQLGMNNSQVGRALEKLSSGYRINRAGDDASGLAISEKMKAQIKGLDTASLNAQDGVSVVQTAEGALTEVHNMLNRMTELATRAANGINSDQNRQSLQDEIKELQTEIDRISKATNFNSINLLDGSLGGGSTSAVDSIKLDGGLTTTNVDATKYKSAALAGTSVLAKTATDGDKVSFTVSYTVGGKEKSLTVDLTLSTNEDGDKVLIGNSGKEYAINDFATDGVTAADLDTAMTAELGKSALANDFTITGDYQNGFVLEAKTAGSGTGVTSASTSATVGGTTTVAGITVGAPATVGEDAYVKGKATLYAAGDKVDDKAFTVNGKKYILAADGTDTSAVGKDITVIFGADLDNAGANAAKEISKDTGLNVTYDTTDGLVFKGGTATVSGSGLVLQIGDTADSFNQITVSIDDMSSKGIGVNGIDISSREGAAAAIDTIRAGIDKVSAQRAVLGATQNRLEYTINNLDTTSENLQSANSRIRDTDMAKMMMEYTKMNVLTQSAQAMLAQANQQPQSVLQLLQ
ncbi:flagellin [Anaerotruncus colihominis]|uniref:flagellin N-terminal helical domain-containing protein n=1 Tax=Anaerotruncus colihominis TaxID=169435 RepID=UPI0035165408